jgi:hypothetical protein
MSGRSTPKQTKLGTEASKTTMETDVSDDIHIDSVLFRSSVLSEDKEVFFEDEEEAQWSNFSGPSEKQSETEGETETETETLDEPELAKNENRLVKWSKFLVLTIILVVATVCGASTYLILYRQAMDEFHNEVSIAERSF